MNLKYNPNYFLLAKPNIENNSELREPQINAYFEVYDHFIQKNKKSHAIVVLPTGVGKTGLMGILPYSICSGRVLIITPQLVIKDAVIDSLDPEFPYNFWLKRKVFNKRSELPILVEYEGSKTPKEVLEIANIVVMNIHKLQKRLDSSPLNFLPEDFFDMIIIDEAHHSTAKTWIDTIHHFSKAKVVKLTGTPFRTDNKKIVGELVYKYKLSQAMSKGYVKTLENFTYVPDKLYLTIDNNDSKTYTIEEIYKMGIKDEDWISRSVAYSLECSKKVVDKSIELLEKKLSGNNPVPHKIIAVACSIKHALQIKELYESKGYSTALIHSRMDSATKEKALKDIENHRVQVVVNVAMLGEGYDHPYLSVAAIFRPFRHVLPYAQFIGRILRIIPSDKAKRADDNIGQIVSHKNLYLEKLWDYYKKEIQESEVIKYLEENMDEYSNVDDDSNNEGTKTQDRSIGLAKESGDGKLIGEAYLDTKLIELRKKEQKEYEEKIAQLQKLLKISREQAENIINQAIGEESDIKRPDKYFSRKKKNIDVRIREEIVPYLIAKFNIVKEANDLKDCILFTKRFAWIPKNCKDNAAMLAIYFNTFLKREIGKKREEWELSDYDIAYEKLEELLEYVEKVLEEYVNIS